MSAWTRVLLALGMTLFPALAMADAGAAPSATSSAVLVGPCAQASLASITNRPGLGRAITINGSPCVVPIGAVVLEASYRNQITGGDGTSRLSTYPNPVVRYGVAGRNEIVLSPSLIYSRRAGAAFGGTFIPATGMQDAGFGFKHSLRDSPWTQDALEAFVTLPTGYPTGSFGFSAGAPTYLLGYSASFGLSARAGLTTTHNFSSSAGTNASGAMQRYFSYQPSLGFSYALSSSTMLLLQDQLAMPTAPGGSTGNRALAAIQQAAGRNVVLDIEFENNLLPAPGFNQHAFGTGLTLRL